MTGIYIPLALRARVIKRAASRCEYCQSPARYSPEVFEIEHILPLATGGKTMLDNLALACPACNRYKGSRQSATEPQTGHEFAIFNPRVQRWSDHFLWSDDLCEIIGATPIGRATIDALRMNRPAVKNFRAALKALGIHPALVG